MCLRPYKIQNPIYARSSFTLESGHLLCRDKRVTLQRPKIDVPCGTCAECRQVYYDSLYQRAIVESQSSYMYFVTLTYDDKHIPHLTLPSGLDVYFSDYTHIKDLFKRLRNRGVIDRPFRYLCVNEYGDKRSRPHFHLLLFVAKYDTDDKTTPLFYERLLFDNLIKYYSVNIGTRKNPIYEPLFTYRVKYTTTGMKSNYFVKYVDPAVTYDYNDNDNSTTFSKTIRYLIGYVNKGSRFESVIENELIDLKDDVLKRKLKNILSCRVRYSKGFGNGFYNKEKVDMPIIDVHLSYFTYLYSMLKDNLPYTFNQYIDLYSDNELSISKLLLKMSSCDTKDLHSFISILDESECYLLATIMIYFPNYFNHFYKCKFRCGCVPFISYYFNKPLDYTKAVIRSFEPIYTPSFAYVRNCIVQGLNSAMPFITFVDPGNNMFMPLCEYYRKRCVTDDDIHLLLDVNHCENLDELIDRYERYVTMRKSHKQKGNQSTHYQDPLQYAHGLQPSVIDLYSFFVNK